MRKSKPGRTLLTPDERRRQLLDAATWAFARKGYRHAQISDIIARAGVARGTFYLYFTSKEQIFLAIVEHFHGQIKAALASADCAAAPAQAISPRAMLQASARRWIEFFAAHRDATTVILREASSIDPRFEKGFADLRDSAVAFFAARFKRLQELGFANPSLAPELFARLQLGMFDELLNAYVLRDPHTDIGRLADQLAEFEWNGIRPDRKE
jgi:TetR/AcrR family transcriptional regulator, fatty acid metabolism regulator protein